MAKSLVENGSYEPWVRIALATPEWSEEKRRRAQELLAGAIHLGEVAEILNCSVFEVQAELGIGRRRDIRAYRRARGLAEAAPPPPAPSVRPSLASA